MSAQVPDMIYLRGVKMELYCNPLEQYWTRMDKRRPQFRASFTCKRGYMATWEIKGRELFLKSLDAQVKGTFLLLGKKWRQYKSQDLLPEARRGSVKATWFSGKLRIPRGKMTLYQHQEYDSRFEREIIITVDRGNVQKVVTLDNEHQVLIVNTTFEPVANRQRIIGS